MYRPRWKAVGWCQVDCRSLICYACQFDIVEFCARWGLMTAARSTHSSPSHLHTSLSLSLSTLSTLFPVLLVRMPLLSYCFTVCLFVCWIRANVSAAWLLSARLFQGRLTHTVRCRFHSIHRRVMSALARCRSWLYAWSLCMAAVVLRCRHGMHGWQLYDVYNPCSLHGTVQCGASGLLELVVMSSNIRVQLLKMSLLECHIK